MPANVILNKRITSFLVLKQVNCCYNADLLIQKAEIEVANSYGSSYHSHVDCDGSLQVVFDAREFQLLSTTLTSLPYSYKDSQQLSHCLAATRTVNNSHIALQLQEQSTILKSLPYSYKDSQQLSHCLTATRTVSNDVNVIVSSAPSAANTAGQKTGANQIGKKCYSD